MRDKQYIEMLEAYGESSNFDYYYYNLNDEMEAFYNSKEYEEQYSDFYIPTEIIVNRNKYGLNLSEVEFYSFLLQRQLISIEKNWKDKDGIAFCFFKIEDISKILKKDNRTISRYLRKLEVAGLLKRVRMGLGLPNRLYLKVIE